MIAQQTSRFGKTYRSFTPDGEVIQNAAKAKYIDGVLELILPKKPGTVSKQIAVS